MQIGRVKEVSRAHGLKIWGVDGLITRSKLNPSTLSKRSSRTAIGLDTLLRCAVVIADHAQLPRRDVLAELTSIDTFKVSKKRSPKRESWGS
jgi:hypothetical protein